MNDNDEEKDSRVPAVDCFMSTPAVVVPPNIATDEDTLKMLEAILPDDHPRIQKFRSIVRNTQVDKRHLALPLEENIAQTELEMRQVVFEEVAPALALDAARKAMEEVQARPEDISSVVTICATSPETMMPGIDQIVISQLGLPPSVRGIPIAQWGCRGGAAGLNLARELCLADPKRSVLVVTVELCSLLYQPADLQNPKSAEEQQAAVICDALFGDAAGACFVCGAASPLLTRPWARAVRMGLRASGSHQLPNSLEYMRYETSSNGLHFRLTNEVPKAMDRVAPVMIDFLREHGVSLEDMEHMDFLLHTGGPKVLLHFMTAVHRCCGKDPESNLGAEDPRVTDSLHTLQAHGNVASVSLLATVRSRMLHGIRPDAPPDGQNCLIAGCGPGMGADWVLGALLPDPVQSKPSSTLEIKDVILKEFDACFIGCPGTKGAAAAFGLAGLFSYYGLQTAVLDSAVGATAAPPTTFIYPSGEGEGGPAEELLRVIREQSSGKTAEEDREEAETCVEAMLGVVRDVEDSGALCCLYHKFEYRGVVDSATQALVDATKGGGAETAAGQPVRALAQWTKGGAGLYELRSKLVVDCNTIGEDAGMYAALVAQLAAKVPCAAGVLHGVPAASEDAAGATEGPGFQGEDSDTRSSSGPKVPETPTRPGPLFLEGRFVRLGSVSSITRMQSGGLLTPKSLAGVSPPLLQGREGSGLVPEGQMAGLRRRLGSLIM